MQVKTTHYRIYIVDHIFVMACSIWRHIGLGVMGPIRVEGSQSGHHHHPTQQMTGVLEHACTM